MNKNLLRFMFVPAGFGRRQDPEDQMDWLRKGGGAPVYERERQA